jgi:hypothetical protein
MLKTRSPETESPPDEVEAEGPAHAVVARSGSTIAPRAIRQRDLKRDMLRLLLWNAMEFRKKVWILVAYSV